MCNGICLNAKTEKKLMKSHKKIAKSNYWSTQGTLFIFSSTKMSRKQNFTAEIAEKNEC